VVDEPVAHGVTTAEHRGERAARLRGNARTPTPSVGEYRCAAARRAPCFRGRGRSTDDRAHADPRGAGARAAERHVVGDPGVGAGRHARPGQGVRRRGAARRDPRRPLARAAAERRHAARDRGRGARDARHPRGIRVPGRRRCGDRGARRSDLARRRRLRHQLRRAAARAPARRRDARATRPGARPRALPLDPRRRGQAGRAPLRGSDARPPSRPRPWAARPRARDRKRGRPGAHRVGRMPPRRGPRSRVRARARPRRGPGGHDRLGEPLRRGAARRLRVRRPPRRSASPRAR
jgi:hypothetical protein